MTYLKHQLLLMLVVAVGFSCKQEVVGLQVQAHDQNQMMQIMHQMMDKMMALPKTGDPNYDFAQMMRVHHQGAIDMANNELQRGGDAQIKALATQIITEQQQEITQLTAFITTYQPSLQVAAFNGETMMAMQKMQRTADLQVITGDADNDMVVLMIPHHQSAIENSQSLLKYGTDRGMRTLAQQIIDSQQTEIATMQEWALVHKPY